MGQQAGLLPLLLLGPRVVPVRVDAGQSLVLPAQGAAAVLLRAPLLVVVPAVV